MAMSSDMRLSATYQGDSEGITEALWHRTHVKSKMRLAVETTSKVKKKPKK